MAYGARLESVLGESPRGFESPILRQEEPGDAPALREPRPPNLSRASISGSTAEMPARYPRSSRGAGTPTSRREHRRAGMPPTAGPASPFHPRVVRTAGAAFSIHVQPPLPLHGAPAESRVRFLPAHGIDRAHRARASCRLAERTLPAVPTQCCRVGRRTPCAPECEWRRTPGPTDEGTRPRTAEQSKGGRAAPRLRCGGDRRPRRGDRAADLTGTARKQPARGHNPAARFSPGSGRFTARFRRESGAASVVSSLMPNSAPTTPDG